MRRKMLIIAMLLIALVFAPKAYAKNPAKDTYTQRCTYSYVSYGVGESTLLVHVYSDNSAYAWITKMNGDSHENDEDIQNWSKDDYVNNGKKCPPYAFIETSWGANVYLYYDKQGVVDRYNKNYTQGSEAHILASNTSEEDWGIPMTEIYALNNDYKGTQNEDTVFHGSATKTCEYTATIDGKVTSGTLSYYDDGTILGEIVRHNGNTVGHNSFKVKKVKHYNDIKAKLDKQECPHYMIVDVKNINEVDYHDDKEVLKSSWNLSIDTRLISWTGKDDDYDPNEDGDVKDKEELAEEEKKKSEEDETRSGLDNDWNPDDPYGFHVGDQFCAEKRVVTGLRALGIFILFARFAVPILIIIFGSKDFINSIMSGKTDSLKQDGMKLGWRVIVGLFVFFVPTIANAFFNGLSYYRVISDDANQCQNCLLNPFNENYCKVGADATGSTDANKRDVDYTNIETTRNASADGELGNTTPGVNAGKIDPNTPGVDASKIDPNTPNVNAGNTGTNTPDVNAGNTGSNTPGVNAGNTGNNPPVVIIEDSDYSRTVVTN